MLARGVAWLWRYDAAQGTGSDGRSSTVPQDSPLRAVPTASWCYKAVEIKPWSEVKSTEVVANSHFVEVSVPDLGFARQRMDLSDYRCTSSLHQLIVNSRESLLHPVLSADFKLSAVKRRSSAYICLHLKFYYSTLLIFTNNIYSKFTHIVCSYPT